MYKTLHKKQGSVTVQLRFARSSVTFCAKRDNYKVTVGKTGNKEIDFVCDKRGEKLYVQVTYLLASDETIQREFGAYDNIRDNYPKYVVSLDEFDMSRNGIKHRNIRDFLLAEEWN